MAYSKELFEYGREVLSRRRQQAFQTLEVRKRKLYARVPRLAEIEKELSATRVCCNSCRYVRHQGASTPGGD